MSYYRYITGVYKSYWPGLNRYPTPNSVSKETKTSQMYQQQKITHSGYESQICFKQVYSLTFDRHSDIIQYWDVDYLISYSNQCIVTYYFNPLLQWCKSWFLLSVDYMCLEFFKTSGKQYVLWRYGVFLWLAFSNFSSWNTTVSYFFLFLDAKLKLSTVFIFTKVIVLLHGLKIINFNHLMKST